MQAPDPEELKTEWQSLFRLWSNAKGIKLRLAITDTVLLQYGMPVAWFYTSKEGYVAQQPATRTTVEEVRAAFLRGAPEPGPAACVAILRCADGLPKLLSRQAFVGLCDQLEEVLAGGEPLAPENTPVLLQAWVPPSLDLRYVTSYSNNGVDVTCHTFQRRFSRRYLPFRGGSVCVPGVLAGNSTVEPGAVDGDAPSEQRAAEAAEGGTPAAAPAVQLPTQQQDQQGLGERVLADMERSLERALGPVDPALKMAARKAAQGLVQYVQRAHLVTLRGMVCEFVRDTRGNLLFMGPLRLDWASLIPGCGGEPWANANLLAPAREEESWHSAGDSEVDELPEAAAQQTGAAHQEPEGSPSTDCRSASPLPPLQQPSTQALLLQPSTTAVQQARPTQEQEAESPKIAALPPVGAWQAQSPGTTALRQSPLAAKAALAGSPSAGALARRERSPGGGSCQPRPLTNGMGAGLPKTPAMLTTHLTRELVAVKDELVLTADLAEQLEAKVQELEHDKRVITDAFERVVQDMQGDLREVKQALDRLRLERDSLAHQLEGARADAEAVQAERNELRSQLEAERATTLSSLGSLRTAQVEATGRAKAAEQALSVLEVRAREEAAVCDALKKQLVLYQHALTASGLSLPAGSSLAGVEGSGSGAGQQQLALALRSGGTTGGGADQRPEQRYLETLAAVEDLLLREGDTSGERYSLAKVLHTCQPDLHAIFLHYCLLDANFVRHWPPRLTLAGWLSFMKDTGATNLVPGTRTRSEMTIHVAEAHEVFRRYALRSNGTASAVAASSGCAASSGPGPSSGASTGGAAMRSVSFKTPGRGSVQPGSPPSSSGAEGQVAVPRPPSAAGSAISTATTMRPGSSLPGASSLHLSYQGFCAALVHVAAKTARQSADLMEACPFLSEQTRAYVESIVPKAQRVLPLAQAAKAQAAKPLTSSPSQKGGALLGAGGGLTKQSKPKKAKSVAKQEQGGGSTEIGTTPAAAAGSPRGQAVPEFSLRQGLAS